MEITMAKKISKTAFCGMTYKKFNFFKTVDKVWASEKRPDGKWRGLGCAGYEYVINNNGNVLTFYTLKEVKEYINAYIALTEANKVMNGILKGVVVA